MPLLDRRQEKDRTKTGHEEENYKDRIMKERGQVKDKTRKGRRQDRKDKNGKGQKRTGPGQDMTKT